MHVQLRKSLITKVGCAESFEPRACFYGYKHRERYYVDGIMMFYAGDAYRLCIFPRAHQQ
jgi:hypothetical protein